MKEITQEFHKKHRMPKSWASKQDVRSWFYGTKVLWLTTVWSICILPRDISYKKWNRLTTSPTTGAPSACLEGAHESQNEDCVAESCPCPGLCCPGNSSWDRPLKGTQNELICKKVLLVCVCHCVFAWVCLWGCVCMWQRFRVYRMTRLYTYHGPLTTWAALCILGVFFGVVVLSVYVQKKSLTYGHSESDEPSQSLLGFFLLFQKTLDSVQNSLNSMLSSQIGIMNSCHVIQQSRG